MVQRSIWEWRSQIGWQPCENKKLFEGEFCLRSVCLLVKKKCQISAFQIHEWELLLDTQSFMAAVPN